MTMTLDDRGGFADFPKLCEVVEFTLEMADFVRLEPVL